MKFLDVFLSAYYAVTLALAIASAASNVVQAHAKNHTMYEESRIVGGTRVDISIYPSQVAVLEEGILICGGSIIRANAVLGAAHCLYDTNLEELTIRSGSNYWYKGGRVVRVTATKLHPFYLHGNEHNFDIALYFLNNPATAPGIPAAIITLWNDDETFFPPGTYGSLAGWGATEEDGKAPSPYLKRVSLPVIPRQACALRYGFLAASYSFCAGFRSGGRDSCHGDSGAGFLIGTKLAGISTFGIGCGREDQPAGFANVPVLRNWIRLEAGV